MSILKFDKEIKALLMIDPCNGFISAGGNLWNRFKAVAEVNNCSRVRTSHPVLNY